MKGRFMKIFKVGQTVYYYLESDGIGRIVECVIKQVTKDLSTKKITYVVGSEHDCGWLRLNDRALTSDYLYASKKQIMKEHADAMAYRALDDKLNSIDAALKKILSEYAEKIQANPVSWATISANDCKTSLYIDGIGNVQEEFDKLKKEVADIKKKIKKPTKKSVKKTSTESVKTELTTEENK